jgi:C-terminal peptidase prc
MKGPKLGFIIGAIVLALSGALTLTMGVVIASVYVVTNGFDFSPTRTAVDPRILTITSVARGPVGLPPSAATAISGARSTTGNVIRLSPTPSATATPEKAVTATALPTRTPFGTPAPTNTVIATVPPPAASPSITPEKPVTQTPVPGTPQPANTLQPSRTPLAFIIATDTPLPSPPPAFTPTAADTARQLRVFSRMWQLVNERYVYPDFNGVDWERVKTQTDIKIKAGISDQQFHGLMRDLITSLNDDHSGFLSPDQRKQEEERFAGSGRYVGIGITTDTNKEKKYVFVLQVVPGSPADKAGIKAHDHILAANGVSLISASGTVNTRSIRGIEGTSVTLIVRTPGSEPREVVVTRASISAAATLEYKLLPTSQTDGKKIGYVLIPTFFEEKMAQRVRDAINDLLRQSGNKLDGLVIDLRTNGGGAYSVLAGNLALFSNGTMGNLVDRKGVQNPIAIKADAIGNIQTVRMAVLIGPATASFAEVFAGALQFNKRAILIGQPSSGNIETLRQHAFEDGSVMWLAEQGFKLPNNTSWEGKGLTPDIKIDKKWDEYTAENDPAISAASDALKK